MKEDFKKIKVALIKLEALVDEIEMLTEEYEYKVSGERDIEALEINGEVLLLLHHLQNLYK